MRGYLVRGSMYTVDDENYLTADQSGKINFRAAKTIEITKHERH